MSQTNWNLHRAGQEALRKPLKVPLKKPFFRKGLGQQIKDSYKEIIIRSLKRRLLRVAPEATQNPKP